MTASIRKLHINNFLLWTFAGNFLHMDSRQTSEGGTFSVLSPLLEDSDSVRILSFAYYMNLNQDPPEGITDFDLFAAITVYAQFDNNGLAILPLLELKVRDVFLHPDMQSFGLSVDVLMLKYASYIRSDNAVLKII